MTDALIVSFHDRMLKSDPYRGWRQTAAGRRDEGKWLAYCADVFTGRVAVRPRMETTFGNGLCDAIESAYKAPAPTPVDGPVFTGGDFDVFVRSIPNHGVGYVSADAKLTRSIRPDDNCPAAFTLKSFGGPRTVTGRLDVRSGCVGVFDTLRFHETGAPGSAGASWVIDSPCSFVQCDMTNDATKIGLMFNSNARGWIVSSTLLHDIGQFGVDNGQHGIYDTAGGGLVVDSIARRCADRAFQLRAGVGTHVVHSLADECGEGVILGDEVVSGAVIYKTVFLNKRVPLRYLIEVSGNHVTGCSLDDCYAWNDNGDPVIQPSHPGLDVTGLHIAPPPFAGYGPRVTVGC